MMVHSSIQPLIPVELPYELTFTLSELLFLMISVFQLGYLVGCRYQLTGRRQQTRVEQPILALPPSQIPGLVEAGASDPSTNHQNCLEVAIPNFANLEFSKGTSPIIIQFLRRYGMEPHYKPFRKESSFNVLFESTGGRILKNETYEIVTEFENGLAAKASLATLKKMLEGVSEETFEDYNFRVVMKDKGDGCGSLVAIQKSQRQELQVVPLRPIHVTGMLENGKFRTQFTDVTQIGKGAYGSVFKATKALQNKSYAIKRIYFTHSNQDFLKEVRAISHISHPNIVRYYSWWVEEPCGEDLPQAEQSQMSSQAIPQKSSGGMLSLPDSEESSHGIQFIREEKQAVERKSLKKLSLPKEKKKILSLYIQMELCEGGNLADLLKKTTGPRDPAMAFRLFCQILNGVQILHQNGIVHRDLKPGNIFVDGDKQLLKIGDFGLAVIGSDKPAAKSELLMRLGTPSYMAPELQQPNFKCDNLELLDVYSLGVIYYQLLRTFGTEHERLTCLRGIKQGRIDLPQPLQRQRRLIRSMTCSARNRLTLSQLRCSKPFLELAAP